MNHYYRIMTFLSHYHHGKYLLKTTNFYEVIHKKLTCLDVPKGITNCLDALSQNTEHKKASDDYMLDILCSIEETATENLPLSSVVNEKENTAWKAIPR